MNQSYLFIIKFTLSLFLFLNFIFTSLALGGEEQNNLPQLPQEIIHNIIVWGVKDYTKISSEGCNLYWTDKVPQSKEECPALRGEGDQLHFYDFDDKTNSVVEFEWSQKIDCELNILDQRPRSKAQCPALVVEDMDLVVYDYDETFQSIAKYHWPDKDAGTLFLKNNKWLKTTNRGLQHYKQYFCDELTSKGGRVKQNYYNPSPILKEIRRLDLKKGLVHLNQPLCDLIASGGNRPPLEKSSSAFIYVNDLQKIKNMRLINSYYANSFIQNENSPLSSLKVNSSKEMLKLFQLKEKTVFDALLGKIKILYLEDIRRQYGEGWNKDKVLKISDLTSPVLEAIGIKCKDMNHLMLKTCDADFSRKVILPHPVQITILGAKILAINDNNQGYVANNKTMMDCAEMFKEQVSFGSNSSNSQALEIKESLVEESLNGCVLF